MDCCKVYVKEVGCRRLKMAFAELEPDALPTEVETRSNEQNISSIVLCQRIIIYCYWNYCSQRQFCYAFYPRSRGHLFQSLIFALSSTSCGNFPCILEVNSLWCCYLLRKMQLLFQSHQLKVRKWSWLCLNQEHFVQTISLVTPSKTYSCIVPDQ